jgi:hypothetical protein
MLYTNGLKRFYEELDIVQILKAIRFAKAMKRTYLSKQHRVLMQLQRQQVITSGSNESEASDYAETI